MRSEAGWGECVDSLGLAGCLVRKARPDWGLSRGHCSLLFSSRFVESMGGKPYRGLLPKSYAGWGFVPARLWLCTQGRLGLQTAG